MALPTLLTTNALKMRRHMFTALVVLLAQEQQELQSPLLIGMSSLAGR